MLTRQGWLPVCRSSSSYWSTSESRVLCRQLGYDVTSNPSRSHVWIICLPLNFTVSCMLDITSQLATHTLLQLHMTSIHAKIILSYLWWLLQVQVYLPHTPLVWCLTSAAQEMSFNFQTVLMTAILHHLVLPWSLLFVLNVSIVHNYLPPPLAPQKQKSSPLVLLLFHTTITASLEGLGMKLTLY